MGQSCTRFCCCCCPDEGEVTPLLKSKKLVPSPTSGKSRDTGSHPPTQLSKEPSSEEESPMFVIANEEDVAVKAKIPSKASEPVKQEEKDTKSTPAQVTASDAVIQSEKVSEEETASVGKSQDLVTSKESLQKSQDDITDSVTAALIEAPEEEGSSSEEEPSVPTEATTQKLTPETSSDEQGHALTADEDLSDSLAGVPPVESSDVTSSGEQQFRET